MPGARPARPRGTDGRHRPPRHRQPSTAKRDDRSRTCQLRSGRLPGFVHSLPDSGRQTPALCLLCATAGRPGPPLPLPLSYFIFILFPSTGASTRRGLPCATRDPSRATGDSHKYTHSVPPHASYSRYAFVICRIIRGAAAPQRGARPRPARRAAGPAGGQLLALGCVWCCSRFQVRTGCVPASPINNFARPQACCSTSCTAR